MKRRLFYGLAAVVGLYLVPIVGSDNSEPQAPAAQQQDNERVCAFCLDPLQYCSKRDLLVSLPCNADNPGMAPEARYHTYCLGCLSAHIRHQGAYCPLCRTLFNPSYLESVLQQANNDYQNIPEALPHVHNVVPPVPVSHDLSTVLRAGVSNRVIGGMVAGAGYAWQLIAHDVAANESILPVVIENLQDMRVSREERERREKERKERENRRYACYLLLGGAGVAFGGAVGVVTYVLPDRISQDIARSLRESEGICREKRANRSLGDVWIMSLWRNGVHMRRQRNEGVWSWRLYAARCFESCNRRQDVRSAVSRLSKNPYVVASTASAILCLIGSYTMGCFDGMKFPLPSLDMFKLLVRSVYANS